MKLLVDMNLSPDWVPLLEQAGFEVLHWSSVGNHTAPDREIMQWARDNRSIVFTHDLDFGILLAHTQANGPSVIQVRAQDVSPAHLGKLVLAALSTYGATVGKWGARHCGGGQVKSKALAAQTSQTLRSEVILHLPVFQAEHSHRGQARHGTSPSFGGQWIGAALGLLAVGLTQRRRFNRKAETLNGAGGSRAT